MIAEFAIVGMLLGALGAAPAAADGSQGVMGIAVGNVVTADYGADGEITAAFHNDGTVDLVFPDGKKSHQQWIADKNYFCAISHSNPGKPLHYHCERNTIQGHKIGQSWQVVDSDGKNMVLTVQR